MRILLTTGGTGGHVFPCLAVASELRERGATCLFVGTQKGAEKTWAEQAGLDFIGLPVQGVLGRGFKSIKGVCSLLIATYAAIKIIKKFKPTVVVGFGSYASFAPLLAAILLNIPIVLHEQNAFAGLTNRLLGKFAKKICLSMPDTNDNFCKEKSVVTGNPVRKNILEASQSFENMHEQPHLLVLGGSQGAKAINSLILSALPQLVSSGVSLLHQTGKQDFERVQAGYHAYQTATSYAQATVFIDDMAKAYAWADVIIARAGASTVAEANIMGKPVIYIPFPYATHDHQSYNAKSCAQAGAAYWFSECELGEVAVINIALELLKDKNKLQEMSNNAKKIAYPQAAESVVAVIFDVIRQSNEK